MKYTYELHKTENAKKDSYSLEELKRLTTLQLREICRLETLVIDSAYKLDREYLIQKIFRFRGSRECYSIDSYHQEGLEKVFHNLGKYLKLIDENKKIQCPERLVFFTDADKTVADGCIVSGRGYQGNVLLLDDKNHICGVCNQMQSKGQYYITYHCRLLKPDLPLVMHKNYKLGFFDETTSKSLFRYYYGLEPLKPMKYNCYIKTIPELLCIASPEVKSTLVIDFGNSNTAVGVYIDENEYSDAVKKELSKSGIPLNAIHKVQFDTLEGRTCETVPTVMSVKNCADGQISYRFGFDGNKNAIRNSFEGKETIFYDIKKWVNSYEQSIEVYDESGNLALAAKRDVLYQYFKFIIKEAERQHKCRYKNIHITSPIKQKDQYLAMYQAVLGEEYAIQTKAALDEGVAVLYNSISNQIENKNFRLGKSYKALVIDCGGGTTDLTSCDYCIKDNQITYKLDINTVYADGDVNFGGNNITFRIFQYLKVLFSNYYKNKVHLRISDIIDEDVLNIIKRTEEDGNLYENLNTMYKQCEESIPTRYNDYKDNDASQYQKARSNFYFFWNLSEMIKISFYSGDGISCTQFHKYGIKNEPHNTKIIAEESWKINVADSNGLTLQMNLPEIIISKEEISRLIMGDIYSIVKKFMEPLYSEDILSNYHVIKLTGQTCKIELFRDALKEFIPGRMIEVSDKGKTEQYYKLTCVEGATKYENARKIGFIAPTLTNEAPMSTYQLTAYGYKGAETTLLESFGALVGSYGYLSRNIDTEKVELVLKNREGKLLHRYFYYMEFEKFIQTSYEETADFTNEVRQEDIDTIIEDEIKVFTYCNDSRWGFTVLPIARRDGLLYIGEKSYFPFENDEWELNYFDGKK